MISNDKPRKKKILALVPDGVGYRNFILGEILRKIIEKADVRVMHSLPDELLADQFDEFGEEPEWHNLKPYKESWVSLIFRRSKGITQLLWTGNAPKPSLRSEFKSARSAYSKVLGVSSYVIAWMFKHAGGVLALERAHQFIIERFDKEELHDCIGGYFDVVLSTHQRASAVIPEMMAARKAGVPTVNFIYSWDNLPKGRMAVPSDYFLVWSDHMKAEMTTYYPEVSSDRVFVTGTPQFEHYFNQDLVWSEEKFRTKLVLESGRKIVVFSGDDITTSPLDPFYLSDVAEAIRLIPQEERPHLVFRRCPVDVSGRYEWVIEKYPEIVVSEPMWRKPAETDSWDSIVPTKDDVELLCNLVRHSDLVINIGSTMALDFAIFDKPAIFIRYDQPEGIGETRREIEEIYSLPHFRVFDDMEPVVWARSKEDLPKLIFKALSSPDEVAKDRKRLLERIVAHPLDKASDRIVSALLEIAERHSPEISNR